MSETNRLGLNKIPDGDRDWGEKDRENMQKIDDFVSQEFDPLVDEVGEKAPTSIIGTLSNLLTTAKDNVVAAINEVYNMVTNLMSYVSDLDDDLASHLAESVYHIQTITRNVTLTGVQTIEVPFKPKLIYAYGYLGGTILNSFGAWAENNLQYAIGKQSNNNQYTNSGRLVLFNDGSSNLYRGLVQEVEDDSFEIDWALNGSLSGTAVIVIICCTHGEG